METANAPTHPLSTARLCWSGPCTFGLYSVQHRFLSPALCGWHFTGQYLARMLLHSMFRLELGQRGVACRRTTSTFERSSLL
jgi:hypothetical protein